jgi:hypothetical protein
MRMSKTSLPRDKSNCEKNSCNCANPMECTHHSRPDIPFPVHMWISHSHSPRVLIAFPSQTVNRRQCYTPGSNPTSKCDAVQVRKIFWRVKLSLHTFVIVIGDKGTWLVSGSGRFTISENIPVTRGCLSGGQNRTGGLVSGKTPCSCSESYHEVRSSSYSNWRISAYSNSLISWLTLEVLFSHKSLKTFRIA